MKRFFVFVCLLIFSLMPVSAENYLVMSDDGRILCSKNEHEQRSIASISKIMTAIVCLEYGDFLDQWTVGEEIYEADEKRIYLVEGQQVSMRSLLYGLMLESGNDAAIVLAKRVGGSVERFVELMNEKADVLGMSQTVFHNPHGLDIHQQGNLSTCFDMALLMNYAIQNPTFCEIIHTSSFNAEWGSVFHNSNKLLKSFPFCLGGKTGFTSKAGRTLVTAAAKEDLTLICVTFNLAEHFDFHQTQYTTLFNTMEKQILIQAGDYQYYDRLVHIDEPMSVTCTDEELSRAQIRHAYDESTGEMIFQFQLDDYCVTKIYHTSKIQRFCFWRWCL